MLIRMKHSSEEAFWYSLKIHNLIPFPYYQKHIIKKIYKTFPYQLNNYSNMSLLKWDTIKTKNFCITFLPSSHMLIMINICNYYNLNKSSLYNTQLCRHIFSTSIVVILIGLCSISHVYIHWIIYIFLSFDINDSIQMNFDDKIRELFIISCLFSFKMNNSIFIQDNI